MLAEYQSSYPPFHPYILPCGLSEQLLGPLPSAPSCLLDPWVSTELCELLQGGWFDMLSEHFSTFPLYTYAYEYVCMYMYMCVCVCVCMYVWQGVGSGCHSPHVKVKEHLMRVVSLLPFSCVSWSTNSGDWARRQVPLRAEPSCQPQ